MCITPYMSNLIGYSEEVLMHSITAWRHVLKVTPFVLKYVESGSIYSCNLLFIDTVEQCYKSFKHIFVSSDHL